MFPSSHRAADRSSSSERDGRLTGHRASSRCAGRLLAVGALALMLAGIGCSKKDDGAVVRDIGTSAPGGTASGSGKSGSGQSGSGSAGGTSVATCEPVGKAADAKTTVNVTLTDYKVQPAQTSAPAGKTNFVLDNRSAHNHEMVIVKGSDPTKLPVTADGAFDEEAYGEANIIGEVEAFPPGQTCNGVFDLAPGNYVLLCNVVDKSANEIHFKERMYVTFTVT